MEPTEHRGMGAGMGPIAEDSHPELVRAMEGERRRAIASRNWLESGMAILGVGMAAVVAGAIALAVVRALV